MMVPTHSGRVTLVRLVVLSLSLALGWGGSSFVDDAANRRFGGPSTPTTEFDVLVYGSTPGGCCAAVAAAREGRRVALVDPSLYIGGMLSGGLSQMDIGVWPRANMGIMMEFIQRIAGKYGISSKVKPLPIGTCDASSEHGPPWHWEAHVAEEVFVDMLRDAGVEVFLATRLLNVTKSTETGFITSVATNTSLNFTAGAFVDASYEGWLMRLTPGVSWTYGREPAATAAGGFNETVAGVLPEPTPRGAPYGRTHQFQVAVNPFADDANTTCLPHVTCGPVAPVGSGDLKNGAYDWRVLFTSNPDNMLPIPEPAAYDPTEFELLRRIIRAYNESGKAVDFYVPTSGVPNNKTDAKLAGPQGFTFEYVGGGWEYPAASWERQQEIIAEHKRFALALLHFWRTDPAVPLKSRQQLAPGRVGLARDEFNRSDHCAFVVCSFASLWWLMEDGDCMWWLSFDR